MAIGFELGMGYHGSWPSATLPFQILQFSEIMLQALATWGAPSPVWTFSCYPWITLISLKRLGHPLLEPSVLTSLTVYPSCLPREPSLPHVSIKSVLGFLLL